MQTKWSKRLFSSAVALMMGLSLLPAGAFAAGETYTAPTSWATGSYTDDSVTITYTIPADADYGKIDFPIFNYSPEGGIPIYDETGELVGNWTWMPGEVSEITLRVVDESGKYSYVTDSLKVDTKELDTSDPWEVVYRSYNPALYSLIQVANDTGSNATNVKNTLEDGPLGELLVNADYAGGVADLDKFYCDFYKVETLDEISDDDLMSLFSGRYDGSFSGYDTIASRETNEGASYLGWKNFYTNLFTVDGSGVLKYTAGSDVLSTLDGRFANEVATDGGVTMTIALKGLETRNSYQNHKIYIGLSFSMEQTVAPEDKTSYPSLDKTVLNGENWEKATSASASGEVSWKLTSNVPEDLLNYLSPEDVKDPEVQDPPVNLLSVPLNERGEYILTFHDQMDDMLVNPEDFVVTVNGKALSEGQYALNQTGLTDGCDFELSMDLVKLYKDGLFTQDDFGTAPIVVTYNATLSEDAKAGDYLNKAWVVYEGGSTEESAATVSTYQIKVYKFDQSTEAPLSGAEFTLTGPDGQKYTAVSGSDGYAYFNGLAEGVYSLRETKAPENYVASNEAIDVTIPNQAADNVATVNFANSSIPHTGGMGTMMFTVGGAAILAVAGALFVVTRRRENR